MGIDSTAQVTKYCLDNLGRAMDGVTYPGSKVTLTPGQSFTLPLPTYWGGKDQYGTQDVQMKLDGTDASGAYFSYNWNVWCKDPIGACSKPVNQLGSTVTFYEQTSGSLNKTLTVGSAALNKGNVD